MRKTFLLNVFAFGWLFASAFVTGCLTKYSEVVLTDRNLGRPMTELLRENSVHTPISPPFFFSGDNAPLERELLSHINPNMPVRYAVVAKQLSLLHVWGQQTSNDWIVVHDIEVPNDIEF